MEKQELFIAQFVALKSTLNYSEQVASLIWLLAKDFEHERINFELVLNCIHLWCLACKLSTTCNKLVASTIEVWHSC